MSSEQTATNKIADPLAPLAKKLRTTIGIVGSEKGGLGKTIAGLTIAEQLTAANHPFFLIDADASIPNVGLTYRKDLYQGFRQEAGLKDVKLIPSIYDAPSGDRNAVATLTEQIVFSGNANDYFKADRIFDLARTQDVLIVLPSQVAAYLNRWIDQNDVVGMLADPDNTIDIVYYFITNGTPESLDLFIESVERFNGKIPHVLVKNLGAPTNIRWDRGFDPDGRVQTVLDKYGFQSIFFPEMIVAPEDKNKILSEYIPFGEAIDSEWIPFSSKRRLTKWLREATQAVASTGLIPYHPKYIPEVAVIDRVSAPQGGRDEAAKAAANQAEAVKVADAEADKTAKAAKAEAGKAAKVAKAEAPKDLDPAN
jgi:hypothetical protein